MIDPLLILWVNACTSQICEHAVVVVAYLRTCAFDRAIVLIERTRESILSRTFSISTRPLDIISVDIAVVIAAESLIIEEEALS